MFTIWGKLHSISAEVGRCFHVHVHVYVYVFPYAYENGFTKKKSFIVSRVRSCFCFHILKKKGYSFLDRHLSIHGTARNRSRFVVLRAVPRSTAGKNPYVYIWKKISFAYFAYAFLLKIASNRQYIRRRLRSPRCVWNGTKNHRIHNFTLKIHVTLSYLRGILYYTLCTYILGNILYSKEIVSDRFIVGVCMCVFSFVLLI